MYNEQYLGKTGGPLNRRINGQKSDFTKNYFERSNTGMRCHLGQQDFTTMIVYICDIEMNPNYKPTSFTSWINRLDTLYPPVMNKYDH